MSNETNAVPKGQHLIAFNCEVCGTKTYCEPGETQACSNGCKPGQDQADKPKQAKKNKKDAEPAAEPAATEEAQTGSPE